MPFPEPVKDEAFRRCIGRCECKHGAGHNHGGGRAHSRRAWPYSEVDDRAACVTPLLTRASAEFHHITAECVGGPETVSNCEVLCHDCHVGTASYGRS